MTHLAPETRRPFITGGDYRIVGDLSTYTVGRCRGRDLRLGALIVDEHGFAEGLIVAKCYGRSTWLVVDAEGVVRDTVFTGSAFVTVATGVESRWED